MANTQNAPGRRAFGWLDKLAYAAGDFGCNMSFGLKGTLTIFWTQYMGVNQLVMAGLLLLVQVWDGINDPMIGALVDADRHKYKRNKFLAYINAGGWGLLVAGALCFIPWKGAPEVVKMILFVVGYLIWDAFYTVANVPYGSMLSLITDDPAQRSQLSAWRNVGATVGGILTSILLPMIIYDAANNLLGERVFWCALLLGGLGLICFQFMVRTTVIRVDTQVKTGEAIPKFNILEALRNFFRNRAAVGATLSVLCSLISMMGLQPIIQVLFQTYFKNIRISGFVSMISMFGTFLFLPFIGKLVKRFGKKELVVFGGCINVFAYLLMVLLPITPDSKGMALYIMCLLIAMLGSGAGGCVSYAMMADAMDYEEWKFGERHEGTTYAMHSFFRKIAQGVAPSLCIVLATWLGYDATLGAAQTEAVALNMRYLVAGLYLVAAILALLCNGVIYNLDKKTVARMTAELETRHADQA